MLTFNKLSHYFIKVTSVNFEKGHLYHIYNQGNNKRKIFFNRNNYLFLLKKIDLYVSPYADILAWCLMPNHFHLMVLVNDVELSLDSTHPMAQSHPIHKTRSLNNSIAIMLRSYTRAINKQENMSGSLFKAHTKAKCLNCLQNIEAPYLNSRNPVNDIISEKNYSQTCFDYIHQNPVEAGLVNKAIDWEFSSATDYSGLGNNKLINKKIASEYIDFPTDWMTLSHPISRKIIQPIS